MSCQGGGWSWEGEILSQPLFPACTSYFLLAELMVGGGAAAKSGPEIMNISTQHHLPSCIIGTFCRALLSGSNPSLSNNPEQP